MSDNIALTLVLEEFVDSWMGGILEPGFREEVVDLLAAKIEAIYEVKLEAAEDAGWDHGNIAGLRYTLGALKRGTVDAATPAERIKRELTAMRRQVDAEGQL